MSCIFRWFNSDKDIVVRVRRPTEKFSSDKDIVVRVRRPTERLC